MRLPVNRVHYLVAAVMTGASLLFVPKQSFAQG